MIEKTVIIKNNTGLHARPASLFVNKASKFKSEIKIRHKDLMYNGKSIISILSMGAKKGDKITIVAVGEDEGPATEDLSKLIEIELND